MVLPSRRRPQCTSRGSVPWLVKKRPEPLAQRCYVLGLAFPDNQNLPACGFQGIFVPGIAFHITPDFVFPESCIGTGLDLSISTVVLVPEATMNENYSSSRGKHKVGFAGQVFQVQPVSEPGLVEKPPDDHFRPCVTPADAGHIQATLLRS